MLSTYLICPACESLFSLELKACPVCGQSVRAGMKRHVYRILPHVVCGNCGGLVPESANVCPFCEAPINHNTTSKTVEVPIELEIVGGGNCPSTKDYQHFEK